MLVFHSHCQMGNQMFIYACARSLAKKRGQSYCLSNLDGLGSFELALEDKLNAWKFLLFRLGNKSGLKKYRFFHYQDNREDYHRKMLDEKGSNLWYYGYFQGENYLFDNLKDIKNCFTIKESFRNQFQQVKKSLIGEKDVFAVHIRLRDYKTFGPDYLKGPDMTLPFDYYRKNIFENFNKEKQLLIFLSDDIKTVKKEFENDFPEAWFSDQSPMVDFQFLTDAKTAVISHSSFAWWAAMLNNHSDKRIIVPRFFLGFKVSKEYPVNMIPSTWEQKDVLKLT
jgi:hypothetical protein